MPAEVPPDSEHTTPCDLGRRLGVGAGLGWREDGCGLSWGLTLSSGLPDASHNIPASSTDLLDSFPLFQEKLPDLCLQ